MSSILPNYAKRLYDLRKEYHLTQEKIAEAIGTTTKTYREWEKSGKIPTTDFLLALSEKFNVSADYLIGKSDCRTIDENIKMITKATRLSEKAIENLLAITKDNATVEMLNIILSDRESLINFLQNLYDIKNNRDIDKRIMISKVNSESKVIDLEEIEKESGETITLKYGISIKDAIKGNALNNINRIIDQWAKGREVNISQNEKANVKNDEIENPIIEEVKEAATKGKINIIPVVEEKPDPCKKYLKIDIIDNPNANKKTKIPVTIIKSDSKPKQEVRTFVLEKPDKKEGD